MQRKSEYIHLEFEEFQKIQTPLELHQLAQHCYFYIQQWIVESKYCSEATALMIFWNTTPYEYVRYSWKSKKGTNEDLDLIRTIINNFEKGFYLKTDIAYDPSEKIDAAEKIPEIVLQPAIGEEPYIYFDEKEVHNWFGDHLKNQIQRCDSSIELYNIAVFLKHKEFEIYEKVIAHPYCDRAIALMMYWRLEHYSTLSLYAEDWLSIRPLLASIEQKLKQQVYPEVFSYDPNVEVNPIKWNIPDYMFMKIN
ncbi:DUF4274 domain-containing protein [Sphingobacterium tabacisoli]|uniref:DUF4274 domain-containing protein n=1 Tax=Sphingobacterium tabacisoli TaxID=2044855 RepID=A0ABW5L7S7_9SPHI|nr:DUF4274 domain-containing protein [Sphingobacterium tabacisoli]